MLVNNVGQRWQLYNSGGNLSFYPNWDYQTRLISFKESGDVVFPKTMTIGDVGTAGIGTLKLAVGGSIGARAIYVRAPNVAWPDYVFANTYRLPPLPEVEAFISAHRHLPGVPSATEVQANGLDVGQMEAALLKKVEELTLYLLELRKDNDAWKARVSQLER